MSNFRKIGDDDAMEAQVESLMLGWTLESCRDSQDWSPPHTKIFNAHAANKPK